HRRASASHTKIRLQGPNGKGDPGAWGLDALSLVANHEREWLASKRELIAHKHFVRSDDDLCCPCPSRLQEVDDSTGLQFLVNKAKGLFACLQFTPVENKNFRERGREELLGFGLPV